MTRSGTPESPRALASEFLGALDEVLVAELDRRGRPLLAALPKARAGLPALAVRLPFGRSLLLSLARR